MAKLKFTITMSLDGYVAGPRQSLENPLGEGGVALHEWAFATRAFRSAHGMEGGEAGLDDDVAMTWSTNIGATIMGRNMFGPVRGSWGDEAWTGWWGDDPPFHTPVFVLTHHPREPIEMQGGTSFHFVTDGIEAALERAMEAAGGQDVAIGGGADDCSAIPARGADRRDDGACRPEASSVVGHGCSRTSTAACPGTAAPGL